MFPNEGSRLLQSAMGKEGLTQGRLRFERPGRPVSTGMVTRWLSGEQKPDAENRIWLAERFGVPLRAWDEPPADGPTVAA